MARATARRGECLSRPGGRVFRLPRRRGGLPLAGLAAVLTAAGVAFGSGLPALAAAVRDAVTSLRFGGQIMEIPTAALPYLGRGLSPSLFRVSALEKAE